MTNQDKTAEQLRESPSEREISYLLALSKAATDGPYQWHPGSDNVVAWNGEDLDICAVYQDEKDTKKTGEFIAAACNFVRKYGQYIATLNTRADSGEAVAWRWRDDVRPGLPWRTTTDADVITELRAKGGYEIEQLFTHPSDTSVSPEFAYAMGWRRAAIWADRDDLICDIDSPAFEKYLKADLSQRVGKGNDKSRD